eukprot:TRINITY_DN2132_c0_g1_i1.p1 TRINITY_DN2132_c0_g1~~TRINITY_DN2132_c0_g1_i1.p1  ORF type:complete len:309 (-),score=42.87 TRINITY_DN2132_c0_g1_i1:312-1238(-)
MTLLYDSKFKLEFAARLVTSYQKIYDNAGRENEKNEIIESRFATVGVQLVNSEPVARLLIEEYNIPRVFLDAITKELSKQTRDTGNAFGDPNNQFSNSSKITAGETIEHLPLDGRLFNDFSQLMSYDQEAKFWLFSDVKTDKNENMRSWLNLLTITQYMEPIIRKIGDHLEEDSESYHDSFTFEMNIYSVLKYINRAIFLYSNRLEREKAEAQAKEAGQRAGEAAEEEYWRNPEMEVSISEHEYSEVKRILSLIVKQLIKISSHIQYKQLPDLFSNAGEGFKCIDYNILTNPFSIHIVLHRQLSSILH